MPGEQVPVIYIRFAQAYIDDPPPNRKLEAIHQGGSLKDTTIAECTEQEGQVWYRVKRCVPENNQLRLRLIQEHHDTALAWHPGQAKTFDLLDRHYYWKEMGKQVDQYVWNSHSCQQLRTTRHATFGVLLPLSVPEKPWEDFSMDFVVRLHECEGFDAVWVVVDRLSKMRHFIPRHTTIDAVGLAKVFLQEVVRLQGLPKTIISDRGPQFDSTFWRQICNRLGIDRWMSTPFHAQTDGQTERRNAGMEQYLRVFVNHQHDDWVQWLPLAQFAANKGVSESRKCTTFFAVHSVDPRMSFAGDTIQDRDQLRCEADQVQAVMQQVHEHLQIEMRRSQAVQEEGANRERVPAPNIQFTFKVWLDARKVRTIRPTRKQDLKRLVPFQVTKQNSPYAYELELPESIRIHRVQPVSHLDPVVEDPLEGQVVPPPRPVEVDGEEEYQVSGVEDIRIYGNQLQSLVRGTGYDSLTWESAMFVDGLQAVEEFH
jgi:transposase InsO family protein